MRRAKPLAVIVSFIGFLAVATGDLPKDHKLLLILLDGFRWDYVNDLPESGGFRKFMENGIRAEHMVPIYPAESYPNYFALTTGLYAESHGVIANYMYDPIEHKVFNMGEGKDSRRSYWFNRIEPIWTTAVRNNISTAIFEWPSADVPINGILPPIATPYKLRYSPFALRSKLLKAARLLASGKTDYCQVFTEWTDFVGHSLGPYTMKNVMVPFFIDQIIRDFYDYVKRKKLDQSLNIIFVSDHGMTSTDPVSVRNVKLEKKIDVDDIDFVIGYGTIMGVYPKDGKEDKVLDQLNKVNGIKAYKKNDIPESYRLKKDIKVAPIYIEVLKGYFLLPLWDEKKQLGSTPIKFRPLGYHGYNPDGFPDMWGTFIAFGPAFKKGVVVPAIYNVDVYNLLSYLLGVKALPNNGTWDNVKDMLNSSSC